MLASTRDLKCVGGRGEGLTSFHCGVPDDIDEAVIEYTKFPLLVVLEVTVQGARNKLA